jgi:hypothetical protein
MPPVLLFTGSVRHSEALLAEDFIAQNLPIASQSVSPILQRPSRTRES